MTWWEIFIILFSLILSAFFSGTEIAFNSANKIYFELKKKHNNLIGTITSGFFQKPNFFQITILFCQLLSFVIYTIYMAKALQLIFFKWFPLLRDFAILLVSFQIIISAFVFIILSDYILRPLILINPERFLEIFALFLRAVYLILYPVTFILFHSSRWLIKDVLRYQYAEDRLIFKWKDLNKIISEKMQSKNNQPDEKIDTKIFSKALFFKQVKVKDCMLPRTDIVAVEIGSGIEELRKVFIESGLTRVLVYKESIDNEILGYCHSSDLFKNPKSIQEILTNIIIIPEITLAQDVLTRMIEERKNIALVVDEFGVTSGMVTLEDVIEEIFGEIHDEYDEEELTEKKLDEQTYLFNARLEVNYLNEKYHLNIPKGEYETLGGFILHVTENIPQLNDVIYYPPYTLTILSVQYSRIDMVRLHYEQIK